MKRALTLALAAWALSTAPVAAGERTVTLAVDNMTCPSCPYIVRKTLAAVAGVTAVEVSLDAGTATVTFDDAETDIDALTAATAGNGYPSRPAEAAGG